MISNPHYPDSVVIKRVGVFDPFAPSGSTETTVYSGVCRDDRNLKTYTEKGVLVSNRIMSIPDNTVVVREGDSVTCTSRNGETRVGVVVDLRVSNFGIHIYWDRVSN